MPNILVADDNFTLAHLISEVLRELGHTVQTEHSGENAVGALAEDNSYDLLLTDIGFKGGINGFELAKRARILNPDLKILYFSGDAQRSSSEMGDVKAPILQKPVPPDELEQAILASLAG